MTIKNILIITYDWMPRNSIAVHRPYTWAKYWSKEGFSVTVLTAKKYAYDEPLGLNLPPLSSVDIIEVAYRNTKTSVNSKSNLIKKYKEKLIWLLKKNSSAIKKILHINFDIRDAWAKRAIPVALELHESRRFDLIVSTYGPRACHFIGQSIKSKYPDVTWLADYRDMWSIRHNTDLNDRQKMHEQSIERDVISQADIFTTVSKPVADELSQFLQKQVHVVFNGFDVDWDATALHLKKSAKFSENPLGKIKIVYTGMIYPGWQDPAPLFCAINSLTHAGKIGINDIQVHFFGHRQPGLDVIIEKNSARDYVTVHGHVDREVALKEQAEADLLLLLESGKPEAKGVLTGKIFEYMISGKPILSLGSTEDSAIGEIIAETGVGIVCGEDIQKIQFILLQAVEGKFLHIYKPNIENISKYSRQKQASEIIDLSNNFQKTRFGS